MAGAPFSKEQQLARGERRYRRKVASPKRWAEIADEKQGGCRVCGAAPPNELHHIVARAQGGDDVAENIAPLCAPCHRAVTGNDRAAREKLFASLTESELAYWAAA